MRSLAPSRSCLCSLPLALAFQATAPSTQVNAPAQTESELRALGDEAHYYQVDYLAPPDGAVLEVGGLAWMPDGRLAVSTRRGQVWLVENALAQDPADARFQLFAEGLQEGLGLAVYEQELYVLQRSELSRLRDVDGDGRVDEVDTIANGWGVSGNYHEFAFGLPVTPEGDFFASFNVSFFSPKWWHGKSPVPYRGWLMRLGLDGSMEPVALGLRSPSGLGFDAKGRLFVTDNQGDWLPSSPIYHVQQGAFYGHPASLRWTEEYQASQTEPSDTIPPERANEREDAAIWIPYEWSRSTGNLIPDASAGRFGPFEEQLMVAELTNGMMLRARMESVRGQLQGAVWPMRQRVGSLARLLQAPDGTVIGGMTNRGWGGLAPNDGLARMRWTGVTPMEMKRVSLLQQGFTVEFTRPLSAAVTLAPEDIELSHYDYDYWWEYGSPERDTRPIGVQGLHLSQDRLKLTILTEALEPARVVRLKLKRVVAADGAPLLHDTCAYTIRQLPEGPWTDQRVAKIVPPPPARESGDEGWLRLSWGDALDAFDASGWELCEAQVDEAEPTRFAIKQGNTALVNLASDASALVSKAQFQDFDLRFDFKLPERGRGGVLLLGGYELALAAGDGGGQVGAQSLGAVRALADGQGPALAPLREGYHGRDQWHQFEINFIAPRFDEQGHKLSDAVAQRLKVDDVLLHERVELIGLTEDSLRAREGASGPIAFRGAGGMMALRDIRVRPTRADGEALSADSLGEGWQPLFDEDSFDTWTQEGDALWELDGDELVGEGPRGHLFSPRGDYTDLELRMQVKISDGGNSGVYLRATPTGEWPVGYEAQINASFPDPQKSASLYDLQPILTHLVGPDTWFEYGIRCETVEGGTRFRLSINGVLVNEFLDPKSRHGSGHIAIQQHHEGSVIEIRDAWVREL